MNRASCLVTAKLSGIAALVKGREHRPARTKVQGWRGDVGECEFRSSLE